MTNSPQPWAVGETLELAWEGFKRSWLVLVGSLFLYMVATMIFAMIPAILLGAKVVEPNSPAYWGVYGVSQLVGFVIGTYFFAGLTRIWVTVARGQDADFAMLFGAGDRFLPMLGQRFLMGVVCVIGFLLLIVPGIILTLGLSLASFYVVDANMGPVDALKASWEATKGHKGNLFLLSLATLLVMFVGMLACCIGYFAAWPLSMIAWAIVYVRLSGRGVATSVYTQPSYPGYGPGGYGQGPGYGPPGGGGYG